MKIDTLYLEDIVPKTTLHFGAAPGELSGPIVVEWQVATARLQQQLDARRSKEGTPAASPKPVVIRSVTRVTAADKQRQRDAAMDISPVMSALALVSAVSAAAKEHGLFDDDDDVSPGAVTFWLKCLAFFQADPFTAAPSQLKQFSQTVYDNADVICAAAVLFVDAGSSVLKHKL